MGHNIFSEVIVSPLIFNTIIVKALFEKCKKSEKLTFYKNLKKTSTNTEKVKQFQKKNNYFIITYANDIIISIYRNNKINHILRTISSSLQQFGLNISKKKFYVTAKSNDKQTKFNYLGFNFNYVPIKHVKKGGLLTCYDQITYQKSNKNTNGIYLIYPGSKEFQYIKNKCKFLIKMLLKKDVVKILTTTNVMLRKFTYYYAWSDSYNRLKTLDGLLFRYFKKNLLKKFKNRGIRRPVLIAEKFLIGKTTRNNINKSSFHYEMKWHPHAELIKSKTSCRQFKKILFLLIPSKTVQNLPIVSAILIKSLRIKPYYVIENKLNFNFTMLYLKRKKK